MSPIKKQHVSKSGKSVLAFRRLSVPSLGSRIPFDAQGAENGDKPRMPGGPAVPINFVPNPPRVYGKP
jgi:hypothetical protein